MKGATMNGNNNTYRVYYKTRTEKGSESIETLVEFDCSQARYMYEIEKAVKNHLSYTASDSVFCNENGGRDYWVTVYIW